MFDPLTLTSVSPQRIDPNHLWGTSHTNLTWPARHGWRCQPIERGSRVHLLGRHGSVGCASLIRLNDTTWDVAYYLDEPATVVASYKQNGDRIAIDARYVTMPDFPGFGLHIIADIERERRVCGL